MVDKRWVVAATLLMGVMLAPFGLSQDADCLDNLNPLARLRFETDDPNLASETGESGNRTPPSSNNSTPPSSRSEPRAEPPPASDVPVIDVPSGGARNLVQLIGYLLAGAVIVFLLYLLMKYFANRSGSLPRPVATEKGDELSTASIPTLVNKSDELATGGDYRMALRYMLTAALRHLDRHGILDYKATATDWEHLRVLQAKGQQGMYDQLLPATQLVERKWYGVSEASREDYERVQGIIQPILSKEGRA